MRTSYLFLIVAILPAIWALVGAEESKDESWVFAVEAGGRKGLARTSRPANSAREACYVYKQHEHSVWSDHLVDPFGNNWQIDTDPYDPDNLNFNPKPSFHDGDDDAVYLPVYCAACEVCKTFVDYGGQKYNKCVPSCKQGQCCDIFTTGGNPDDIIGDYPFTETNPERNGDYDSYWPTTLTAEPYTSGQCRTSTITQRGYCGYEYSDVWCTRACCEEWQGEYGNAVGRKLMGGTGGDGYGFDNDWCDYSNRRSLTANETMSRRNATRDLLSFDSDCVDWCCCGSDIFTQNRFPDRSFPHKAYPCGMAYNGGDPTSNYGCVPYATKTLSAGSDSTYTSSGSTITAATLTTSNNNQKPLPEVEFVLPPTEEPTA